MVILLGRESGGWKNYQKLNDCPGSKETPYLHFQERFSFPLWRGARGWKCSNNQMTAKS